jgi:[acyl-carrier-protein] S-malonyltransferase
VSIMSESSAFVFPGMGPVRFADVADFMLGDPSARERVAVADEVLDYSLVEAFRRSEDDYSEAAQVSFMVLCVALADWAERTLGVRAGVVAGPSFGGKAATAFSGALPFPDAVRMTAELARVTADYFAREHTGLVTQSFVRVPADVRRELQAELDFCEVACYIDDDFAMVTVDERHLEWLQGRVRAAGGLPLYTMRPPMHSPAFLPLRHRAEAEVIAGLTFADPVLPVVDDHDGAVLTTGDGVRTMLLDSFTRPLRWPETVTALRDKAARLYVCGPDSLFGRVAVTKRHFAVTPVNPRVAMMPRPASVA